MIAFAKLYLALLFAVILAGGGFAVLSADGAAAMVTQAAMTLAAVLAVVCAFVLVALHDRLEAIEAYLRDAEARARRDR